MIISTVRELEVGRQDAVVEALAQLARHAGTRRLRLRGMAWTESRELIRQTSGAVPGAIDLPAEQAAELLAPLRALGPIMDTFPTVPTSTLGQIHLDPSQPTPGLGDGFILDDLPVEAIETLLDVAGPGVESPLLLVDLRHLTGAIGRPDPAAGALDHLPGRFLGMALGVVPFPQAAPAGREAVDVLVRAIGPWRSSRDYLNFREVDVPGGRFFSAEAVARLSAVRSAVNSDQAIRGITGSTEVSGGFGGTEPIGEGAVARARTGYAAWSGPVARPRRPGGRRAENCSQAQTGGRTPLCST